ncbi:MAG: DUF4347 domain-containing protein [Crocosphaera sp.]
MTNLWTTSNIGKKTNMNAKYTEKQLVLIDGNVPEYSHLIDNIPTNSEVIVLDTEKNGIEEITQVLAQQKNLDNIHLISHGNPGTLYLGNTELNNNNLGNYAAKIREWQKALANQANLILYGCSVAAGTIGETFVKQISELLSVNIAASKTLTGDKKLGGNWDLEFTIGQLTSELLFNENNSSNYGHVLNDPFYGQDIEDDIIYGSENTDEIHGLGGDDRIYGENPTQPSSSIPQGTTIAQIDRLFGGEGDDTFVFGTNGTIFYDRFGFQDYGIVEDFEVGDKIELFGKEDDYTFVLTANGGTAIFSQQGLIGLVKNFDITNTPGAIVYDSTLQSAGIASNGSVTVEAFANTFDDSVEDIIGSSDSVDPQGAKIDQLIGAAGSQNFVLGSANESWYDGLGYQDYAIVSNFDVTEDTIQLNGVSGNYELTAVQTLGDGSHMRALFSGSASSGDLIGVVMGSDLSGLDLTATNAGFTYVTAI